MEDLATLFGEHVCASGECTKKTHTQPVLVGPADVATPAAEIALLGRVRDALQGKGLRMLEGEPTPRFSAADDEPVPWGVHFDETAAKLKNPAKSPTKSLLATARETGELPTLWEMFWPFGRRKSG